MGGGLAGRPSLMESLRPGGENPMFSEGTWQSKLREFPWLNLAPALSGGLFLHVWSAKRKQ
jgi:hypothetical protein